MFPVFLIIYALIFNGFVFIFTSIVLNNFVAIFDSIILNGFVFILTSVALNVFAAIFDDLILIVVLNDNFFRFLIAHIIRRQIFSHEFSKEIRIFLAETICQNTHIICFLCFFICFILSFCIIHTHSICLCCCIFSCICLFRGFNRRYLFFRHRFRMPFSIHRFRHFQAMISFWFCLWNFKKIIIAAAFCCCNSCRCQLDFIRLIFFLSWNLQRCPVKMLFFLFFAKHKGAEQMGNMWFFFFLCDFLFLIIRIIVWIIVTIYIGSFCMLWPRHIFCFLRHGSISW